jgi:ribosomal protein S12 methylthiotransferase accessory factor
MLEDPDDPRALGVGLVSGVGCHPIPTVALAKALREGIQTRVAYFSARDNCPLDELDTIRNVPVLREYFSEIQSIHPDRRLSDLRSHATGSVAGDIATLRARLRAVGCETIVSVNLTSREIGVPVAKLLVPGLEGKHSERAPGRRLAGVKS